MVKKKIIFTVTNDLSYDQRMHRICTSLSKNGYSVVLIGRQLKMSKPLIPRPFKQHRLNCLFKKSKFFYAEFNLRLFFYLLFKKADAICSIDLDTILAGYYTSKIKRTKLIYDAHELFTELIEVKNNPSVEKIWKRIERKSIQNIKYGYTVCKSIAEEFNKRYGVQYEVIRNVPLAGILNEPIIKEKTIVYSGAVNEGRCFEQLIPAMKFVNYPLIICGGGNFFEQAKKLAEKHGVSDRVIFKGWMLPVDLKGEINKAYIGINLVENKGLNQYYSLPNKFFDYIQAGVPQITVGYPEYKRINDEWQVAVLTYTTEPAQIALQINNLMEDFVLYETIKKNCLKAREILTWENEEKILLDYYRKVFDC